MNSKANRVLVADDDPVSQILLERNLAAWGFTAVTAADGEEAMAILECDDAPSLAILDWMMPKISGPEVCARIREHANRPYTYLLMLTAKNRAKEIAEGLLAGADDYLLKPFDPEELQARLAVGQRLVGLERKLERKVADLEAALADVRKLKSLLPICMYCKSVRDDQYYWHTIDEYVHQATGTDFSHGICPSCMIRIDAGEIAFWG
jgi:DNA-binding response OmpR family regulator